MDNDYRDTIYRVIMVMVILVSVALGLYFMSLTVGSHTRSIIDHEERIEFLEKVLLDPDFVTSLNGL